MLYVIDQKAMLALEIVLPFGIFMAYRNQVEFCFKCSIKYPMGVCHPVKGVTMELLKNNYRVWLYAERGIRYEANDIS